MKTLPTAVQTLFAKRSFIASTLYSFTLITGQVLNYTSADRDITWSGTTYASGSSGSGILFERSVASGGQASTCSWKSGLEVGNLEFDVIPGTATINGVSFLTAVKNGVFDGATLTRYRAYMDPASPSVCVGTILLDVGRVAEILAGRSYATFTINDYRELLNVTLPRNLYQCGCTNSLYDQSCTVSKAAYTVSGTVGTGSTISQVVATLSQATGYFDLGVITFTSGLNNGAARSVKQYILGAPVQLMAPFANAPAAGNTFTIYPGCSKDLGTCTNKFSNQANFRGMPYIPDPSTAT